MFAKKYEVLNSLNLASKQEIMVAVTVLTHVLFLLPLTNVSGSNFDVDARSLSEILTHSEGEDIFTCNIIDTYYSEIGYVSVALVTERFRGKPKDTVIIISEKGCFNYGEKRIPTTEWLILGHGVSNKLYRINSNTTWAEIVNHKGFICHQGIMFGKDYIKCIQDYISLEKAQHTGVVTLILSDKVLAHGQMVDGKAHGLWKHYDNQENLKSEIEYNLSHYNGTYKKYRQKSELESIFIYNDNTLVKREEQAGKTFQYDSIGPCELKETETIVSENGDTLLFSQIIFFDLKNNLKYPPSYQHGYYYNIADSTRHGLSEGFYFRGHRFGPWKYFNSNGEIIEEREYNFPDTFLNYSIISQGLEIFMDYPLTHGQPLGKWTYYKVSISDSNRVSYQLEGIEHYNSNSELAVREVTYGWQQNRRISMIENGEKHGIEMDFNLDGNWTFMQTFQNGLKHGPSMSNYRSIEKLNYYYGFKHGKSSQHPNIIYEYGAASGYWVQNYPNSSIKMHEGKLWRGERIGKWKHYDKEGKLEQISYHETDLDKIKYRCHSGGMAKTEYYEDGELIRVFDPLKREPWQRTKKE